MQTSPATQASRTHGLRRTVATFALGATISNKDGTIDTTAITSIAAQFKELVSPSKESDTSLRLVAVVGAGGLGREYVEIAREHSKAADLDQIGIDASRVNALLLIAALRKLHVITNSRIPETMKEFDSYNSSDMFDVIVLGGLELGMTSDSTAAMIAQHNRTALVIVSTAGGIFGEGKHQNFVADATNKRNMVLLPFVDKTYLRRIITAKPREHVLDAQTCMILLDKRNRGMKVIVTGYSNIQSAMNTLYLSKSKKDPIKGTTRIVV